MPLPEKYTALFSEQQYYHVACKSLPNQVLFHNEENKRYFLEKYKKFISPFTETYAYSLLDNHAHFIIQTKSIAEIQTIDPGINSWKTLELFRENSEIITYNKLFERQFNSLFVSYTRSINNTLQKTGNLFSTPFKRVHLSDDIHISHAIIYVHANVQRHQILSDFRKHAWSSYRSILSDKPTLLARKKVIDWFGGKLAFEEAHEKQASFYYSFDE